MSKIKIKIFAYTSMIVATILGLKAQSISYFVFYNIIKIDLIYFLTGITIISMLLFLILQILIYKFTKMAKNKDKGLDIYLGVNMLVGFIISSWSFFIMIAWWG